LRVTVESSYAVPTRPNQSGGIPATCMNPRDGTSDESGHAGFPSQGGDTGSNPVGLPVFRGSAGPRLGDFFPGTLDVRTARTGPHRPDRRPRRLGEAAAPRSSPGLKGARFE